MVSLSMHADVVDASILWTLRNRAQVEDQEQQDLEARQLYTRNVRDLPLLGISLGATGDYSPSVLKRNDANRGEDMRVV